MESLSQMTPRRKNQNYKPGTLLYTEGPEDSSDHLHPFSNTRLVRVHGVPGADGTRVKQPPPEWLVKRWTEGAGSEKASGEVRAVMKGTRGITHVVYNPGCT